MEIEINMNETGPAARIISKLLAENDFNRMNDIVSRQKAEIRTKFLFPNIKGIENAEFISVQRDNGSFSEQLITEKEFFKIAGVSKNGLSSRSGRYQEYLYGHYIEAKEQNDSGYISDIFSKALEFQNNLNYVRGLTKNKSFKKKWHREFGKKSALKLFKDTGDLRIFNIINAAKE